MIECTLCWLITPSQLLVSYAIRPHELLAQAVNQAPAGKQAMDETVCNGECGDWRCSDEDFLQSFALPARAPSKLATLHPFPREERLRFDAASHTYFLDGRQVPISVTGLLHKYSCGFSPKAALAAMRSGIA